MAKPATESAKKRAVGVDDAPRVRPFSRDVASIGPPIASAPSKPIATRPIPTSPVKPVVKQPVPTIHRGGIAKTAPTYNPNTSHIAVFIDLDNTNASLDNLMEIFAALQARGTVVYGKVYGYGDAMVDIFDEFLIEHGMETAGRMRLREEGVSVVDTRLVLDALRLNEANRFDKVFVWAGAGDLIPLFSQLREQGTHTMTVDLENFDTRNRFVDERIRLFSQVTSPASKRKGGNLPHVDMPIDLSDDFEIVEDEVKSHKTIKGSEFDEPPSGFGGKLNPLAIPDLDDVDIPVLPKRDETNIAPKTEPTPTESVIDMDDMPSFETETEQEYVDRLAGMLLASIKEDEAKAREGSDFADLATPTPSSPQLESLQTSTQAPAPKPTSESNSTFGSFALPDVDFGDLSSPTPPPVAPKEIRSLPNPSPSQPPLPVPPSVTGDFDFGDLSSPPPKPVTSTPSPQPRPEPVIPPKPVPSGDFDFGMPVAPPPLPLGDIGSITAAKTPSVNKGAFDDAFADLVNVPPPPPPPPGTDTMGEYLNAIGEFG